MTDIECNRITTSPLANHAMMAISALTLLIFTAIQSAATTLDDIKRKGFVSIGVKSELKPWGFIAQSGEATGFEIDLARDLADRLGVPARFVPVLASNRVSMLESGAVDFILAIFAVTDERKTEVKFIEPSYYASMSAILQKEATGNTTVSSDKRKLCGVEGMYSNVDVAKQFGTQLLLQKSLPEAEAKLLAGQCDGISYSDVFFLYEMRSDPVRWAGYEVSQLLSIRPVLWSVALAKSTNDPALEMLLARAVRDWHRSGWLLQLEKKWIGENSMSLLWLTSKVNNLGNTPKG